MALPCVEPRRARPAPPRASPLTRRTAPFASLLGNIDIGMVIGLIVSSAVYWMTCRSLDCDADRPRVREADLGLTSRI